VYEYLACDHDRERKVLMFESDWKLLWKQSGEEIIYTGTALKHGVSMVTSCWCYFVIHVETNIQHSIV
jgi:hypothetical protein